MPDTTDAQAAAMAELEREYGNAKVVEGPFNAIPNSIGVVCRVTWPEGPGFMARLIGPDGETVTQAKGLPK